MEEHSLRCGSNSRQRRNGDTHRRSFNGTSNRSLNRGQREHKRDDKECFNKNAKDASFGKIEEWTKVISRRKAKERKKITSEDRTPHKYDIRGNPSNYHLNWRNKEDITSFYFTHVTDEVNEVRLWEKFKVWGDVREVFIAKRRNKEGRRYVFVRFKGVSDVNLLEVQLDNIFIDDQKLFVNLPRFARSAWNLEMQTRVGKGGEPKKGTIICPEATNRPRVRSYAEVTAQRGVSGGRTSCEGDTPIISVTPHEGRDFWCKGA